MRITLSRKQIGRKERGIKEWVREYGQHITQVFEKLYIDQGKPGKTRNADCGHLDL